jgi:hypothetical protein
VPTLPAEIANSVVWERVVGRPIDRGAFIDSQSRARQLLEQSKDVVRRLEAEGIPGRAAEPVHLVGICTGLSEPAVQFRNSNLIPTVQAKNVHDMLRDVRFVVETTSRKQLRMAVVSNGWQPLDSYREEHKRFTRLLSRFAAAKELDAWGIEILFYNVENTVQRDAGGAPMLNQHSHLLIRSRQRLGAKRWTAFLDWARSRFPKGYFHDAGRVVDPAECVKYAFKPAELDALTSAEFAELFRQTYRLKFFQPIGELRAMRRELKERRMKLVQVPAWFGATREERVWAVVAKAPVEAKQEKNDSGSSSNVIVGMTLPQPRFSVHAEPCLIVKGWTGDIDELVRARQLVPLVEKARRYWDRNVAAAAAASMGHTTTTTDREEELGGSVNSAFAVRDGPHMAVGPPH